MFQLFRRPTITLLVFSTFQSLIAQQDSLQSLVNKFNAYKTKNLQEKLYLHIDRQTYLVGETVWFQVYCLDASTHKPLDMSKVAYIEFVGKGHKVAFQTKVKMEKGLGNGSVFLTPDFNSGNYIIRAYTKWMKNSDPNYFFQQPITIINTYKNLGLEIKKDSAIYDIQFYPEGGNLVQGLESKVAFKATKNGHGINGKGYILNQKNDTVAKFKPINFGIGHFRFIPLANNEYKAYFKDGKKINTVNLPALFKEGMVMQLEEIDSTSIKINVSGNSNDNEAIHLVVHSKMVLKIANSQILKAGKCAFLVDRKLLSDGISHFTVFNSANKPVCERLYFKMPAQHLAVELKANKLQYAPREKADLGLNIANSKGVPQQAQMSLSVFLLDALQPYPSADISNYLWLTSDLRGAVESPDFYIKISNPVMNQAIDNLMLTHGWRRFKWENVRNQSSIYPAFFPEYRGHVVAAKVRDSISQNMAENVETYLSAPGKILKLYNGKSDKQGNILFETQELYGQKEVIIQTLSPTGRKYKVEVLNPFSDLFTESQVPYFDLDEKLSASIVSKSIDVQSQNIFTNKNLQRNSLTVDSFPFYGKGDENYKLDDYTRFKTMEDVMKEYVPGVMVRKKEGKFAFRNIDIRNKDIFSENPLVLLDGVPVFEIDSIMKMDPIKIKKLQVVTQKYFLGSIIYSGIVSFSTYEGDMAGFFIDNKWTVFDYEGLQMNKEFYAPKYDTEVQKISRMPDYRHLLYWSPNIALDTKGEMKCSFYTSDKLGKYVAVLQGITQNGSPISKYLEFEVMK